MELARVLRDQISELLEQLSASPAAQLDTTIEYHLRLIANAVDADQVCWYELDPTSGEYCPVRMARVRTGHEDLHFSKRQAPFLTDSLDRRENVVLERLADLPARAEQDRRFLEKAGVSSVLVVPSSSLASRKAALGLLSYSPRPTWTKDLASQLAVLSNIIGISLQRKDAEEATEEIRERFRYLFVHASIGIALEEIGGRLLHVNPAFCSMLGYTEEELLELTCEQISHPYDKTREEPLFEELSKGIRTSYLLQKRFFRKDGSQMWAEVSVSLLRGSSSGAPLVIGMVSDITQRVATEERLRSSEARLQHTLDVLSSRIAILDESGIILETNANWRKFAADPPTGHRQLDVGTNFLDICDAVSGEGAQLAKELADKARLLLSGSASCERMLQRFLTTVRGEVWFRIVMTRFEENGAPRMVLSCMDVTELMWTRDALAQNRERLSLALEASNTGTWDWNITTNKVCWTDNQSLVFAEEEREFDGNLDQLLRFVHPDDRKNLREVAESALQAGNTFAAEFRMPDRQGRMRWVMAKGRIARDPQGHAVRMLGVNVDITELKSRDRQLQKLARRLMEAHEEERRRISRELHDDIGQRVALLGCELEQQIRALPATKRDREKTQLRNLQKQVNDLATDIHELSHDLHSTKLQHCGLGEALKDLCLRYSESHHLEIALSAASLDRHLASDVALCLFRVAQEALANAAKHSLAKKVLVEATQKAGRVCLKVKDLGVGFNPSAPSEGIGLTSMRERLRTVGGVLTLRSSLHRGTEIIAEVPVPLKATAAAAR